MCVIGTKIKAAVTGDFLKTDPYIGLNILNQVAYMYRAICIGQSLGYNDFIRHIFPFQAVFFFVQARVIFIATAFVYSPACFDFRYLLKYRC